METKAYKPAPAMFFGGAVYVGVVLAMSTLFISFVLTAFPANAYFSRLVMTVAGVLIGLSAIAFPVALHMWTVEKTHRIVATVLYYGEILIMAVNSIVSFMTLLSTYTDYVVPEWAKLYEPFAIASIVYTLAAWGTIFLLDPSHKRTQKEREADERLFDRVADKRLEFVDSIEGENVISQMVTNDIQTRYDPERFKRERRHFGGAISVPAPFVKKEMAAAAVSSDGPRVGDRARYVVSSAEPDFWGSYGVHDDVEYNGLQLRGGVRYAITKERMLVDPSGVVIGAMPPANWTPPAKVKPVPPAPVESAEEIERRERYRAQFADVGRGERAVLDVLEAGECSCPSEFFDDNPSDKVRFKVQRAGGALCYMNGMQYYKSPAALNCERCAFFTRGAAADSK